MMLNGEANDGIYKYYLLCLFVSFPIEMFIGVHLTIIYISVAIGSLAIAAASVRWSTALQNNVPSDHLAGVFAFDYVLSVGISPIGFILFRYFVQRLIQS